jgi:hypothetical protein
MYAFQPVQDRSASTGFTRSMSYKISVTGTSAATLIVGGGYARVYNASSDIVYIDFGSGSIAATATTSIALAPGVPEVWALPNGATHIAAITSSSADLYVTMGNF